MLYGVKVRRCKYVYSFTSISAFALEKRPRLFIEAHRSSDKFISAALRRVISNDDRSMDTSGLRAREKEMKSSPSKMAERWRMRDMSVR